MMAQMVLILKMLGVSCGIVIAGIVLIILVACFIEVAKVLFKRK